MLPRGLLHKEPVCLSPAALGPRCARHCTNRTNSWALLQRAGTCPPFGALSVRAASWKGGCLVIGHPAATDLHGLTLPPFLSPGVLLLPDTERSVGAQHLWKPGPSVLIPFPLNQWQNSAWLSGSGPGHGCAELGAHKKKELEISGYF